VAGRHKQSGTQRVDNQHAQLTLPRLAPAAGCGAAQATAATHNGTRRAGTPVTELRRAHRRREDQVRAPPLAAAPPRPPERVHHQLGALVPRSSAPVGRAPSPSSGTTARSKPGVLHPHASRGLPCPDRPPQRPLHACQPAQPPYSWQAWGPAPCRHCPPRLNLTVPVPTLRAAGRSGPQRGPGRARREGQQHGRQPVHWRALADRISSNGTASGSLSPPTAHAGRSSAQQRGAASRRRSALVSQARTRTQPAVNRASLAACGDSGPLPARHRIPLGNPPHSLTQEHRHTRRRAVLAGAGSV
jgi:hypothetical protein